MYRSDKIFVTGTDTDVGKTVIAAWLCTHWQADYWKPIQSGTREGTDSEAVAQLSPSTTIHEESYVFSEFVSPHLAADLEGEKIDITNIAIPKTSKPLLIEGAGGLCVPINDSFLMIDLIAILKVPVLVVARSTLGTINHTCLTIQALREKHIPILGVILNGPFNRSNAQAIEQWGQVPILAECPLFDPLTKESLQSYPLPKMLQEIFDVPSIV